MPLAAERQSTAEWAIPHFAWALFFTAGFGIGASLLTTDGTPDFKIYHYYNGFAAHHVRLALDIFPGQLQTAFFHGTDYIYYWLFTTLNNHPILLNVALSIPYSIAAFVVFQIALLFAGAGFFGRDVICALAAVAHSYRGLGASDAGHDHDGYCAGTSSIDLSVDLAGVGESRT